MTVSADLPFAQSRFCSTEGVEVIQVLSDHRDMSFGKAYGTLVKDLRLESRAVFVIDGDNTVRYAEYVPVAGQEPNYQAAITALKDLL